MKTTLRQLKKRKIEKLVIESVDLSLYIAHAVVDGDQILIVEPTGKPLKTRNLLDMKTALSGLPAREMVLSQSSSYDEMVGHRHGTVENRMEVSLRPGFESLPPWQH